MKKTEELRHGRVLGTVRIPGKLSAEVKQGITSNRWVRLDIRYHKKSKHTHIMLHWKDPAKAKAVTKR